jgi:hypothetical protein
MFEHSILLLPDGEKRVLLHSCCAPCSGGIMEALLASHIEGLLQNKNTLKKFSIPIKIYYHVIRQKYNIIIVNYLH